MLSSGRCALGIVHLSILHGHRRDRAVATGCMPRPRRRWPPPPVAPASSRGKRSSPGSCGSRISASSAIRTRRRRSCCGRRRAGIQRSYAPPPPSDLLRLLGDPEARVRRRAALALGRVGLPKPFRRWPTGWPTTEPEVRQMAAFALGLIGDASARTALLTALKDQQPLVQGRAAEALGADRRQERCAGDRRDGADPHPGRRAGRARAGRLDVAAGAARRSGASRPVRAGAARGLRPVAASVLDGTGQPVSPWWPVAYALQRVNDARATPALLSLLKTPGRYTAAFAARGLGALKAPTAARCCARSSSSAARRPP